MSILTRTRSIIGTARIGLKALAIVVLWLTQASLIAQTASTPTVQFPTVADMVAARIPAVANRLTALVSGRVSVNDSGGGIFFYNSSSSINTNLGTVFKPAASAGRWLRQYSGPLMIDWFGAVAGGSEASNLAAIQNAFDVAGSSGESVVFNKLYSVDGPLTCPSGISVTGLGDRSSSGSGINFLLTTNASVKLLQPTGANWNQLILDNLTLTIDDSSAFGAGNTAHVLYVDGGRFVTIRNCFIKGVYGEDFESIGMEFISATGVGDTIFDNEILYNWMQGFNTDIYLHGQGNPAGTQVPIGFLIEGNKLLSLSSTNTDAHIRMTGALSVVIQANEFNNLGESLGAGAYDIWADGCRWLNISGNYYDGGDNGRRRLRFDNTFQTTLGVQIMENMITTASIYNNTGGSDDFYTIWEGWTTGALKVNSATVRGLTGIVYANGTSALTAGTGTAGTLAKFSASSPGLANSIASESGTVLSVVGSLSSTLGMVVAANGSTNGLTFSQDWVGRRENAVTGDWMLDNGANNRLRVTVSGDVRIPTEGKGLQLKEGSNARMGTATLVNGTVTVANTSVTANTRIFLTRAVEAGTTVGILGVGAVVAATSFVIESVDLAGALSADDDSTVNWLLIEPSP